MSEVLKNLSSNVGEMPISFLPLTEFIPLFSTKDESPTFLFGAA